MRIQHGTFYWFHLLQVSWRENFMACISQPSHQISWSRTGIPCWSWLWWFLRLCWNRYYPLDRVSHSFVRSLRRSIFPSCKRCEWAPNQSFSHIVRHQGIWRLQQDINGTACQSWCKAFRKILPFHWWWASACSCFYRDSASLNPNLTRLYLWKLFVMFLGSLQSSASAEECWNEGSIPGIQPIVYSWGPSWVSLNLQWSKD